MYNTLFKSIIDNFLKNPIYIVIIVLVIILPIILPKKRKRKKTNEEKGAIGEKNIKIELEKIPGYKKITNNVYLPSKNGETTEVDLIMIHENGIFFIESKNYNGWIFGKEIDYEWTQSLNKNSRIRFYNPLKQNKGHINAFLKLKSDFPKENIYSIVVFGNNAELKNINYDSKGVSVIKNNELVDTISKINKINSKKMSNKEVDDIYNLLKKYSNVSKETKEKHISNIRK